MVWLVLDGNGNLEVFKTQVAAVNHLQKNGGFMIGETKLRERSS